VKLIFDAGFECGGASFVQTVIKKFMKIMQEFATAITGFFTLLKKENILNIDVTVLSTSVREFLMEFVKVTECSCEDINKPLIRMVIAPLWNDMTDAFVNSATGVVMKVVQIPYLLLTDGTTTFEPLFEVLLLEETGVLAAGAAVLNDHLKTVIDVIQNGTMIDEYRFKSPPVFSIVHRYYGVVLEAIHTFIKVTSVIPLLMLDGDEGQSVANQAHVSASMHGAALQSYALAHVVAVECFESLGDYFREFGELMISGSNVAINGMELLYNMSVHAAVGVPSAYAYPPIGYDKFACESKIAYDGRPVGRIRNALVQYAKRYSAENVPLQEKLASSVRAIIDQKFLAVSLAESLYALGKVVLLRLLESRPAWPCRRSWFAAVWLWL
jgi:hypothetical protein